MNVMQKVAGFDWDDGNWPKCGKHGVSKSEIEQVLESARFQIGDPYVAEPRLRTFGHASNGRYIFVVFALRQRNGKQLIRPISARYMHRKEIEHYEKEVARIEERRRGGALRRGSRSD